MPNPRGGISLADGSGGLFCHGWGQLPGGGRQSHGVD